MYDFGMKKWTFLAELPFDSCIKCFMFLPISSVVFSNKMGKRYRLGQANLQFSLFQNEGILGTFHTFKCGNFSNIKI